MPRLSIQLQLAAVLFVSAAHGQIEPTSTWRTVLVAAHPDCPGSGLTLETTDAGPWEQGLSLVLPCPAGSVYALGAQHSNITAGRLEAAGLLSVGMHGVRAFYSSYELRNTYSVQFHLSQRGYYRIVANTGGRESASSRYGHFLHSHAHSFIVVQRTGEPNLFWCESDARLDGDQTHSRRRLLMLEPGDYEVDAHSALVGEMDTLEPDQVSVHLRYDFSLTPVPCPADITADGQVDTADLALLLSYLGDYASGNSETPEQVDIDGNLWVDAEDLAILLSFFGQTCD